MNRCMMICLVLVGMAMMSEAAEMRADVIKVTANGNGGHYGFYVTLASDETGCEQYADWWEVLDSKGRLLYRRILFHSHPNDQPFTRSGGTVPLEPESMVYVRGHMNKRGYAGDVFAGSIAHGFKKAEKVPVFPKSIETQKPLPNGCAF